MQFHGILKQQLMCFSYKVHSYFVLLLPLLPLYSTFVVIENCACFLSTQNIYIATSVYYTLAVLFTLESGHLLFPFKQQLKPANDTSFNCNDSENTNLAPCIFFALIQVHLFSYPSTNLVLLPNCLEFVFKILLPAKLKPWVE